ncbi:phage shock protein C (PspC) family protein [Virgibacillus subterraneus]|uniref:Phage shock protein C (PspC) family protein n=3 Tax=Virgibacillus TaxID=84406 RepID=A0A1H0ZEF4_9BACI|nr:MULTISPECIES: PspC domain-containing protein [Virgibacillus]MBP1947949.1 phage shock protein C [Virgibacillus litoralis]SDQ25773.1 phage shock protein C (PspC) family protein [Virgibacillus salinus]SEP91673.1 phage shock protein C (PspC) family protein [Virgibacillus subterraneus]
MSKKLYRSESDVMIGGICGGLAEYFNIDSTIVRLLFVAGVFVGAAAIFIYLIGMIVIPKEGEVR